MKCTILHESRGRMRVRMCQRRMTTAQADKLHYYLQSCSGIKKVTIADRTRDATILFEPRSGVREEIIRNLSAFDYETSPVEVPEHTGRELSREYEDRLFFLVLGRAVRSFLLPVPFARAYILMKAAYYIREGLRSLRKGRLEVPVLDATTITVSLLRSDFSTAGSVMFLLDAGALLEEWTHKKSVDDLARRMYLNVDKAWVILDDKAGKAAGTTDPAGSLNTAGTKEPAGSTTASGIPDPAGSRNTTENTTENTSRRQEVLLPVSEIRPGDHVVVRTGNVIPLDGVVVRGEGAVNQASMTGESLPVHKTADAYVYAGTVLEEGELEIRVEKALGSGRYDKIVHMIEDSEALKSATESRASHLADSLVPWSLGGTALAYLLTRNATRALSFLMVDFSCALKLAMPISVLSAMRECSDHHINVKGGKFLEAVSRADTIVFDKTGTLTRATPTVRGIITFCDAEMEETIRKISEPENNAAVENSAAGAATENSAASAAGAAIEAGADSAATENSAASAAGAAIEAGADSAATENSAASAAGAAIENELLRLAACLEEHFPHSIANAVVREAARRGLAHEEHHAKVEYVVAHGIASSISGVRALIGSYHFIFEDEKCTLPKGTSLDILPDDCSLLYLALGGRLAAVICIDDPIRPEAARAVEDLHRAGFSRIVMMTGDSRRTAAAVAEKLGMDEFYAEVLPEDKAAFVRREHEAGRKVVMIGDGINDSPALSESDAGIAISAGAAIAREIADITISADDLGELVVLRRISNALMHRIDTNYRRIMTFNGGLIALGLFGMILPANAALLHNISTIYFSVDSMKDLL